MRLLPNDASEIVAETIADSDTASTSAHSIRRNNTVSACAEKAKSQA
jgi:hypothetical protein